VRALVARIQAIAPAAVSDGAVAVARPGGATISDVARASGVSATTVSNALNGVGRVRAGTRERVRQVAAELGYRPSLRAQRLRRGQSRMIGLVSSMPAAVAGGPARLGFYMEVAAAAAETALSRGFALVLTPPARAGVPLDELDIDGAIVVEPEQDDVVTADLQGRGLAVVTLGPQAGSVLPHVDLGSETAAGLLLDHLYQQGARQVALLIGDGRRDSYLAERSVYERWAADRGMAALVAAVPESGGVTAGQAACARLLAERPHVDAVCAMVDAFAVGCVAAVRAAGRRVPDDVLIATRYDGLLARTCDPPLTAVDLHLGLVAAGAVDLLLAQLAGGSREVQAPVPPPVLVPRRSSLRQPDALVRATP
jgi:DNA-binding LacI/PurR family transcriptional regulator